jgi:hypothetical protein
MIPRRRSPPCISALAGGRVSVLSITYTALLEQNFRCNYTYATKRKGTEIKYGGARRRFGEAAASSGGDRRRLRGAPPRWRLWSWWPAPPSRRARSTCSSPCSRRSLSASASSRRCWCCARSQRTAPASPGRQWGAGAAVVSRHGAPDEHGVLGGPERAGRRRGRSGRSGPARRLRLLHRARAVLVCSLCRDLTECHFRTLNLPARTRTL